MNSRQQRLQRWREGYERREWFWRVLGFSNWRRPLVPDPLAGENRAARRRREKQERHRQRRR